MKRWGLSNRLSNKGFSLLEVLIALSIVSITLLGFAETELAALKIEHRSLDERSEIQGKY